MFRGDSDLGLLPTSTILLSNQSIIQIRPLSREILLDISVTIDNSLVAKGNIRIMSSKHQKGPDLKRFMVSIQDVSLRPDGCGCDGTHKL